MKPGLVYKPQSPLFLKALYQLNVGVYRQEATTKRAFGLPGGACQDPGTIVSLALRILVSFGAWGYQHGSISMGSSRYRRTTQRPQKVCISLACSKSCCKAQQAQCAYHKLAARVRIIIETCEREPVAQKISDACCGFLCSSAPEIEYPWLPSSAKRYWPVWVSSKAQDHPVLKVLTIERYIESVWNPCNKGFWAYQVMYGPQELPISLLEVSLRYMRYMVL